MSRTLRIAIGFIAILVFAAAAVFAYITITGGSGEASRETEAAAVEAAPSAVVFQIVPAESEVRFLLDEDLRGSRITVVGKTNRVAGQIAVDFTNPANTRLGEISINVRTLETDNGFRNSAIRGQILLSSQDAFEFAQFVPTSLDGLPESVTLGEPFSFTITGDFTLKGITRAITFDVTVTPESETRIVGSARAVVQRADFDLQIPSVPGVANVEEEVELELDFVAAAVEEAAA